MTRSPFSHHSLLSSLCALALALVLVGCREEPKSVCQAGRQVVCVCLDGAQGTQACRDDGSGFEFCQCARPTPEIRDTLDLPDAPEVADTAPEVVADTAESEDIAAPDAPDIADTQPDVDTDTAETDTAETDTVATDTAEADTAETDTAEPAPDVPDITDPDVPDTTADTEEVDVVISPLALGAACTADVECLSQLCLAFSVGGMPQAVCSRPCCHEALDCERGFGCAQLGGGTYCLPAEVFPRGVTFDGAVGTACSSGGQCQSDLCDVERGCLGSCCTDADCSTTCRFLPAGTRYRTYCDSLGLLAGGDGAFCFGEFDCASGICLPSVDFPGQGQCTSLCCRDAQCGVGRLCGLIAGPTGGVARACVPATAGTIPDGSACTDDAQCRSNQCVANVCRSVCCTDGDCSGLDRCAPVPTTFGVTTNFCIPRLDE
jgi:hypothetical protein